MLTFEESREALSQIADNLPPDIFKELNGGIILLPDTLSDDEDFLILGQYHEDPQGLGRYITIYYGSMIDVYGHLSSQAFRKELEAVLYHELVHHLESLAGDHSLEIEDALEIERYLKSKQ